MEDALYVLDWLIESGNMAWIIGILLGYYGWGWYFQPLRTGGVVAIPKRPILVGESGSVCIMPSPRPRVDINIQALQAGFITVKEAREAMQGIGEAFARVSTHGPLDGMISIIIPSKENSNGCEYCQGERFDDEGGCRDCGARR